MTYEEIMGLTEDIKMEYKYNPMKNSPVRPNLFSDKDHVTSVLGTCESNVIGMDDGKFFGVQCLEPK